MDFEFLIESLGESGTTAFGGLLLGLMFGVFAQRSQFCLRAAVVEFVRGSMGPKVAIWLLTFSAAVGGTQALILFGELDITDSRMLASYGSLSGAVLGGLLFGAGMILARGCGARLLVLAATGNLRALFSGLLFAAVAQASLRGILAPARDGVANSWLLHDDGGLELIGFLGLGDYTGIYLSLVCMVVAVIYGIRNKLSTWAWVGSVGVGAMVVGGWWFTYHMSYQTFEPTQVESMTFTGPSADTLMYFLTPGGAPMDFDVGLVPGVFLGSFLAATLSRTFKIQGFKDGHSMIRYIVGASFMGMGGMLAGGCAVGAGLTGGSAFSITAWIALASMWAGAGITDALVDREWKKETDEPVLAEVPVPVKS
ncbi:MAG: YeeE/YedE family protein [Neptuniibacter sp.]